MKLEKQEINRKLLHLIALLMPIGIFYLPIIMEIPGWMPPVILGLLFLCSAILDKLRIKYVRIQKIYHRLFHLLLRSHEQTKTTGATYIIGGAFLCSVAFINLSYISFMVLTLFILGDGAAAIIGLSIGRTKILNKTLEGSLACFLMCMMLFAFLFPYVPFLFEKSGKISIPLMIITSLSITLLELIPIKISNNRTINDNLYVPVLAGLIFDKIKPLF